jgi:hypothetical protein
MVCAMTPAAAVRTTKSVTVAILIDASLFFINPSSWKMKMRLKILSSFYAWTFPPFHGSAWEKDTPFFSRPQGETECDILHLGKGRPELKTDRGKSEVKK